MLLNASLPTLPAHWYLDRMAAESVSNPNPKKYIKLADLAPAPGSTNTKSGSLTATKVSEPIKHWYTPKTWRDLYVCATGFRVDLDHASGIVALLTKVQATQAERKFVEEMEALRIKHGNEKLVLEAVLKAYPTPENKPLTEEERLNAFMDAGNISLLCEYGSLLMTQATYDTKAQKDPEEAMHPVMSHTCVRKLRVLQTIMQMRGCTPDQLPVVSSSVTETGVKTAKEIDL